MVNTAKIILAIAEFSPDDAIRKVGGYHTLIPIDSDVDSVFQPGWQSPSDFPTDTFDQYRKVFWRNETGQSLFRVQAYGFNVKNSNIVGMALEKGQGGAAKIDGSENIKNYQTAPSLFGTYEYQQIHSDEALDIGNSGTLPHQSGQGIWLRQRITRDTVLDPSDEFRLGLIFTEIQ